jgi:hypothetical protein
MGNELVIKTEKVEGRPVSPDTLCKATKEDHE